MVVGRPGACTLAAREIYRMTPQAICNHLISNKQAFIISAVLLAAVFGIVRNEAAGPLRHVYYPARTVARQMRKRHWKRNKWHLNVTISGW